MGAQLGEASLSDFHRESDGCSQHTEELSFLYAVCDEGFDAFWPASKLVVKTWTHEGAWHTQSCAAGQHA